jgi:hypothetical protein
MAGFGTPPVSPLPVVAVDIGPVWAGKANAVLSELQAIVTPKIGPAQIDLGVNGDVKHGPRTVRIAAAFGRPAAGAPTLAPLGEYWTGDSAGADVMFPLSLDDNQRLLEVSIYGEVAVATAWTMNAYAFNLGAGGFTALATVRTSTTAPGITKLTITGLTTTVGSPMAYMARWIAGAAGNRCRGVEYRYDRIATP